MMCEVFGFSSKEGFIINEYLKTFFGHSNSHPHGWGLACLDSSEVSIEKEPMRAEKSNYLHQRLTQSINAPCVLAHIRYATIGNIDYRNCHPYTRKDQCGRRWTMIHNGTIFDYPPLHKYVKLQEGDTDSERILMYFVDQINAKSKEVQRELNPKERFAVLDSIVSEMARGNKLNLLLYDGEYMYVHTNYKESLYYLELEEGILFSTQPLSGEEWKLLPFTTFLGYKDGQRVMVGTNHKNEYIESAENMKFLYQTFSNL